MTREATCGPALSDVVESKGVAARPRTLRSSNYGQLLKTEHSLLTTRSVGVLVPPLRVIIQFLEGQSAGVEEVEYRLLDDFREVEQQRAVGFYG